MRGQWTGTYKGQNVQGDMIANIDEVGDHFECEIYIAPYEQSVPASVGYASTTDKGEQHRVTADVYPIDPRNARQTTWENIKDLYPEGTFHNDRVEVTIREEAGNIYLQSVQDPSLFSGIASKFHAPKRSKVKSKVQSWHDFKAYLTEFADAAFLFRGQAKDWPLRTAFHRRERYRLNEFVNQDIFTLHRRLSGLTDHYFDLSVPDQNGAFLNLIQHHGYPTPLLDWSYSPYVAAFFAFRDVKKNSKEEGYVRIFLFDAGAWRKDFMQLTHLALPSPHLSVMEFLSMNNPRQFPQQAVTTVTNVADIESHILIREQTRNTKYIYAVDIPYSERETAMKDLKFMGITAGSIFPGIDGVCEALREVNFDA